VHNLCVVPLTGQMDISYANSRIRKLCTDAKEARKKYGKDGADVLEERLKQMRAAQCLEDLRLLPGGWHELTQNRKGQLACSLLGMNRLVFQPANDPRPVKSDGGLDWTQVTALINLEIVDYH